ncbi:MAG: hypothetical protein CVU38_06685 [Chloroflexi bacterium HGW-Chloroflexi-1]|nr:MAG: hypothetical protein CVU38_06685 [Chloroflexi bacterium HGW-Chloroflexi-1]
MTNSLETTRNDPRSAHGTAGPWRRLRAQLALGAGAFDPGRLVGLALVLAFAVLYLWTLDNGLRPGELEGGDLITHQYAQVQARPSNAPGYPLYTMGGWLWFRLGRLILGQEHNPIPILSSFSTLWALLALWLLYRLILEVTGRGITAHHAVMLSGVKRSEESRYAQSDNSGNGPVAALVTAFYGGTYFFWYYAVTTEQYTSAVAWTLAVLLLAFRWEGAGRESYLLAIAFLAGVGLAHMVTVLFILPPLLWFVSSRDERGGHGGPPVPLLRRPKLIAAALGLAALPLLSYVYVYVRGAQHPEWRGVGQWASTWQWFWSFLSTSQGRSELTWSLTPFSTKEFPSLIWGELTWPGLVAGLLGLAALGRRRAIALYATLGIYLAFCWVDRLGNWYQVIMPAYALLALGIAAGADWVWRVAGAVRGAPRNPQSAIRFLILLTLTILLLYRGSASYPRADSRDWAADTGLAPGWAILADDPPAGTAVLGTLPEALALDYLTEIWGERPDLRAVTSTEARALLGAGRPLAITEAALPLAPAEVSPDAHYSALGRTLIAVSAAPNRALPGAGTEAPPRPWGPLQPWTHDFGAGLKLVGGMTQTRRIFEQPAGLDEIVVMLVWQATVTPDRDWSVSVRLTRGGQEIAQLDRQNPVDGAYPMTRWSPGEVVADAYPFARPAGAEPDGVTVILYHQTADGGYVNLDVTEFMLR